MRKPHDQLGLDEIAELSKKKIVHKQALYYKLNIFETQQTIKNI